MQECRELPSASAAERVLSIDVFRGLTILAMIFANDLDMAGIKNVPAWMKHSKVSDYFTFVDVVAPAFLFIVGTAIPFAIRRRLQRGASHPRIWAHILIRTVSLMIIGIFMGNMRQPDVVPAGISHALWSVLLLASFIVIWNDYPQAAGFKKAIFIALRLLGLAVLVYLALVYRQKLETGFGHMKIRWYVIGTIGWCYLTACVAYFLCRKNVAGMVGCAALLVALYMGDQAGVFNRFGFMSSFRRYVPLGNMIGARALSTVCGVIVGMLFMEGSPARTPRRRIIWMVVFAAGLYAAGCLLRPKYGLAPYNVKVTPVLGLYCAAICCVLYALLYWLVDVRQIRGWCGITLPAGRNPLLPYFLAFMLHPLTVVLHVAWLNDCVNTGTVGIVRTGCVALLIGVLLTALLSRRHVRLRL